MIENSRLKEKGLATMKKHLRKILCAMMCLIIILSGVNVFASETRAFDDITWRGDYSSNSKPKLIVTVTTPVDYVQQVTAVVYDSSKTSPTLADYIRITDDTVDERGTKDITFTITNNFSNEVKVDLKGNGYDVTEGSATVNVIKPNEIDALLAAFNTEDDPESDEDDEEYIDTISDALSEADLALQLEYDEANTEDSARVTRRIDIMKNIKAKDLEAPYANLEDVRFAWEMSDIIAYVEDNGSTAGELLNKIETNSEYIDVSGINPDDYNDYIDDVCQDILSYASEYNSDEGVKCANDLEGMINQYVGLRAVNAATAETIYDVFGDYNQYFEIPAETLDKYNNPAFGRSNQDKALRSVQNKGFEKNSVLRDAFVAAMDEIPLPDPENENQQGTPPSNDGPGPSIAGPGMATPNTPPESTDPTPTAPSFKDVPSSHWAYEYISKLAANGTISGYDDGTFRPNNNVTREEFVKMIIGATGLVSENAECDFSDVPKDAWYYIYVASGYSKKIISGINDSTFGIGRNITRQDVAVIAARILAYFDADTAQFTETTLTDIDTVSDYAQDSVKLLNGMGIISGFDDGSFKPHNALTRAEAAAIISRLTATL